jgi:DNA-binding winged helix-turn-helix (wHTH) protein/TolB-like protein/lipoprotein NlpI
VNKQLSRYYEFGPFRLNATDKLLHRNGESVPLTPKLIDTLVVLVENCGHVVTKEELMETLWPDSFVEESSLTQNISLLRKALTENGSGPYIKTIPKRGYRFVAAVREVNGFTGEPATGETTSVPATIAEQSVADSVDSIAPASPTGRAAVATPSATGRVTNRKVYLALLSACIVLVSVAFYLARRSRKAEEAFVPKSIAVLPFRTVGFQDDSELIGLGMADAVVLKLTSLNRTTVLPASSVSRYTKRENDVLTIGRQLGVEAVLDGTVQRDGDRVRVTALLIRTSNGRTFWSGKFDESYKDTFALQESISTQLTAALVPNIEPPDKGRANQKPTENADAYRAYVSGLYFWNKRGTDNLRKATSYLEEAIKKDANFAQAHAILADCYYLCAENDLGIVPRAEALARARNEATRALELDSNLAEAHTVKAGLAIIDYDFGTAECEYHRAIELNPKYALAHLRYGYLLLGQGKLQDAVSQMQQAQDLDPVSPISNTARGLMLYMSRDYDGAIKAHKKALELQPDLNQARANLALAYATKGMFQEASAEFAELRNGDALLAAKTEIYTLGLAGRTADARQMLSELRQSISENQITPYDYVILYAALGDKDKAFEWLEKVDIKGFGRLKFDPELDLLRGDVRFAQFLARLHTKLIHPPGES